MSTRMYCYRIAKDKLWMFLDQVRAWYLVDHSTCGVMEMYGEKRGSGKEARRLAGDKETYVGIQLFDEGETWLFRVLERGYMFMNHWESIFPDELGLQEVFYDDRAETPEDWKPNKQVAEWLDEQIHARHYLLYPVIDETTLWERFASGQEKRRSE